MNEIRRIRGNNSQKVRRIRPEGLPLWARSVRCPDDGLPFDLRPAALRAGGGKREFLVRRASTQNEGIHCWPPGAEISA